MRGCRGRSILGLISAALVMLFSPPAFLSGSSPDRPSRESPASRFRPAKGEVYHFRLDARITSLPMGASRLGGLSIVVTGPLDLKIKSSDSDFIRAGLGTEGLAFEIQTPEGASRAVLETSPWRPLEVVFDSRGEVLSVANLDALPRDSIFGLPFDRLLRVFFPRLPENGVDAAGRWQGRSRIELPLPDASLQIAVAESGRRTGDVGADAMILDSEMRLNASGSAAAGAARTILTGTGTGVRHLRLPADMGLFSEYSLSIRLEGAAAVNLAGHLIPAAGFALEAETRLILTARSEIAKGEGHVAIH